MEAGGFAELDTWLTDYERASGQQLARESFQWWMIFNMLWWGVSCLRLGSTFRDGSVPSVERTIIGRRISEVEVDLLLALAEQRHQSQDTLTEPPAPIDPELPLAQDITYPEMVTALSNWNRDEVLANASGHQIFASRVANNALGIVNGLWRPCTPSISPSGWRRWGIRRMPCVGRYARTSRSVKAIPVGITCG